MGIRGSNYGAFLFSAVGYGEENMMNWKRTAALILTAAIAASAMAGCSAGKQGGTSSKKQEITWALSDEPETLDPSQDNYLLSTHVLLNMWTGLFKTDASNKLVKALCDSYTVDSTEVNYTFKIKSSAKWSDGKPVTAADFEYSWKRVLNPDTASPVATDLYALKNAKAYNSKQATADSVGVKAVDDQTLQVTLEKPDPNFLYYLAYADTVPLRKDIIEANKDWTKSASTYITDGPFQLSDYQPKSKYVLSRNPNYYDAQNVKLQKLNIVFIPSNDSELAAYTSNEIDVDMNLNSQGLKQFQKSSELHNVARIGTGYYDFNCKVKPFDDARVRRAFSMAIDRKQIINNILQSGERPAEGEVPYGVTDPADTGKQFRDLSGNLITENASQAKQLLADAGYPNGTGMPAITLICKANDTEKDVAQALQSMWKQNLGVQVDIKTIDTKVYWTEVHQGNFSIASDGWTADYPDPVDHLNQFITSATAQNNRWSNAEYDKLIDDSTNVQDQKQRSADFVKAEKLLMQEMPVMPLRFFVATYIAKPGIQGIRSDYSGHMLFENAYIR